MSKANDEQPTYGIGYDPDEMGHYPLVYGPDCSLDRLLKIHPGKSVEILEHLRGSGHDPENLPVIVQISHDDGTPDKILYRWIKPQQNWRPYDPSAKVRQAPDFDKKGKKMPRVNRMDFLQQLETVQPGISPRGIIQQSDSFVFKDGYVMTYNDEVACKTKSVFGKNFVGAVKEAPLLAILRKLVEDEVDVEESDGELIITGKRRKAGIRMDATIELPLDKIEKPTEWKPLPDDFTEAVSLVQECASTDESHFVITCVHLHPKYIEACDNYQLTRYKIRLGIKEPTLVKRDSLKSLTSLEMTEFAETANWIHFRNKSGVQMSCRRYSEAYPDISRIMEMGEGHPATLPKGLGEAAEKAQVFSAENGENDQVFVELVPGKLRIKGQGASGWYQEVKNLTYDGGNMSFFISPKLLIELTKKHNQCAISSDRLLVNGGKFVYVTVLGREEDELQKDDETDSEDSNDAGSTADGE